MRVLIALGGNALLKRGEPLSATNQLANIRNAAVQLARIAAKHEVILTHGNGPQVGLLALQAAAYLEVEPYPLDVLGAESQGMVGYLLEQELSNLLPSSTPVVSLITRVEVAADDRAFAHPTKPIGPMYSEAEARILAIEKNWQVAADGPAEKRGFRRVVASPKPLQVLNLKAITTLMNSGAMVIAAGGGGIPVVRNASTQALSGVEAVIDKDLTGGMLAAALQADCLLIATDVEAVFLDWGKPAQSAVGQTTPNFLEQHLFAAGSMGPKVKTVCEFVKASAKRAVIGSLDQIEAMLAGTAGTQVVVDVKQAIGTDN
jgi:carbamate kinase